MKRNWIAVSLALVVLFSFGQASADTHVTASVPDTLANGNIPWWTDIRVDLGFWTNYSFDHVGYGIALVLYSPDESISKATHLNVASIHAGGSPDTLFSADKANEIGGGSWEDSSITEHNGWAGIWTVFNNFISLDWDGNLPDTVHQGTASTSGWPAGPDTTIYISFHLRIEGSGTFCIDSCTIPNMVPAGKYDWLWDDPVYTFNGPYCWTVEEVEVPPVITQIGSGTGVETVDEGQLLTFDVWATEPNGQAITLTAPARPDGANFTDHGDGTGTFDWTPYGHQSGEHPVTFYADDGLKVASSATVMLIVNDALDVSELDRGVLPAEFELGQNYPNPFNPYTAFEFAVPHKANVSINIYNILGQRIRNLVDAEYGQGYYMVDWDGTADDGSQVATGIYFYKIVADDFVSTKKLMLLR